MKAGFQTEDGQFFATETEAIGHEAKTKAIALIAPLKDEFGHVGSVEAVIIVKNAAFVIKTLVTHLNANGASIIIQGNLDESAPDVSHGN